MEEGSNYNPNIVCKTGNLTLTKKLFMPRMNICMYNIKVRDIITLIKFNMVLCCKKVFKKKLVYFYEHKHNVDFNVIPSYNNVSSISLNIGFEDALRCRGLP